MLHAEQSLDSLTVVDGQGGYACISNESTARECRRRCKKSSDVMAGMSGSAISNIRMCFHVLSIRLRAMRMGPFF